MAILNLDLGGIGVTIIDQNNADTTNTLDISALGSHTLIVDGVDVSVNSIVGVELASAPTFQVQNGGSITIEQGLLNIAALTDMNFNILDDGEITLDGSSIGLLGDVTGLLNTFTVDFSGVDVGCFTYIPPNLSVLDSIQFDVTGMQAGDELDLGAADIWELDIGLFGSPDDAYFDNALHIRSTSLLGQDVYSTIEMSAEDYAIFAASPSTYMSGNDFTYPGNIVCFAGGTRILTIQGYRPIDDLRKGDLLRTLNGQLREIIWIGSSHLDEHGLDLLPNLRPIQVSKNAFGQGYPETDLALSPQHRIYVNGEAIQRTTDAQDGLLAAKHMTPLKGIRVDHKIKEVTYFHILLTEHDVIWAENLPVESMYIGPHTARNLDPGMRSEIAQIFPDFAKRFKDGHESKFNLLRGNVSRRIIKSHGRNRRNFFAPGKVRRKQQRNEKQECLAELA